MHLPPCAQQAGMTRRDVVVIVGLVVLAVAISLPMLGRARFRARLTCCNCRLKQIGLAFRMFSNDHGDKFPWDAAGTNGGSREFWASPQVYRHYLVASNELNTPKILACPMDRERQETAQWGRFTNSNLSYFISLDANEGNPSMLLSGDRNVEGGSLSNGFLMTVETNTVLKFSKAMHNTVGNVGLADGSAQQVKGMGLSNLVSRAPNAFHLALP